MNPPARPQADPQSVCVRGGGIEAADPQSMNAEALELSKVG